MNPISPSTIAVALSLAAASAGHSEGLFRPATPAETQAYASRLTAPGTDQIKGVPVIRRGLLVADPNYVRARIAPSNLAGLPDAGRAAAATRLPPEIHVELFPDLALDFRRTDVLAYGKSPDKFVWSGSSARPYNCDSEIVVSEDVLKYISIQCGGKGASLYYVKRLSGKYYSVSEIKPPLEVEKNDVETIDPISTKAQRSDAKTKREGPRRETSLTQAKINVSVLIAYAFPAEACQPDEVTTTPSELEIDFFQQSNNILTRSGVDVTLVYAGSFTTYLCHASYIQSRLCWTPCERETLHLTRFTRCAINSMRTWSKCGIQGSREIYAEKQLTR